MFGQDFHFKLGPIGGLNTTYVQTNIPNFNNQASSNFQQAASSGYFAGVFCRFELGRLYLQPEGMFNTKSAAISGEANSGGAYNVNFNLTAYDLNLLAGYDFAKFGEWGNVRGFVGVGKSFLTNTSISVQGINLPTPDLNAGTANGIVGLGVDLLRFTADVRIEHSFTELYTPTTKVSDTVFMLTLGLKFL